MNRERISKYQENVVEAEQSSFAICEQVERILLSPEFYASKAQREFLEYVIEKTLAGQSDQIKGYAIATEVFGRREDFDQAIDPIVSIQANKLRRALDLYYAVSGRQDPIRIDIPKGSYVPVFKKSTGSDSASQAQQFQKPAPADTVAWPTILVLTFENLTGDPELEYVGVGIATEITLEITRYQEIRVIRQTPIPEQESVPGIDVQFVLGGSIRSDVNGLKVTVNLVDGLTGIHIWGDAYREELSQAKLISFEENVARKVVGNISSEFGIMTRTLSSESKRRAPENFTTYQAILRFYQFDNVFSPQMFFQCYDELKKVCKNDSECGLAWSMLARLYSINHSLELFDLDTPLEKAFSYAKKGVDLDPANQRIRLIMAFIRLFNNELTSGLAEVEYALKLNPHSLILLGDIGYLMTLFGDWERGPMLIRQAIENNPYHNPSVRYALWVNWVRQGEYAQAYEETLHFRRPLLFWEPLMRAAALALMDRIEDGRKAGEDFLKCKPDFPERGRILIKHYIKFDDIVERMIKGLEKVDIIVS